MSPLDFVIRLALAQALGAAIGVERQWRHRLAGLTTNTLVSTGSALFTMLAAMAGEHDPLRTVATVVTGIGFLGGGVIVREGMTVRGLNTAATLWCAASVGCLAGAGLLWQSSAGAAAILAANLVLHSITDFINRQPLTHTQVETRYACTLVCRSADEARLRALMLAEVKDASFSLEALHSEDTDRPGELRVRANLAMQGRDDKRMEHVVSRLSMEQGVPAARWEVLVRND